MIDVPHAGPERPPHFRPGGIGMAAGDEQPALARGGVEGLGAGQLGGTGRDPDQAAGQQLIVLGGVGIPPPVGRVAADLAGGKIWAVEMDAGDPGTVLGRPDRAGQRASVDHSADLRGRARGRGRKDARGAMARVDRVCPSHRVDRAVHVVCAATAVDMDVDEPGGNETIPDVEHGRALGQVHFRPDRGDPAARAQQLATRQDPVRQGDRPSQREGIVHGMAQNW
jgi:hypothetical protein